MRIGIDIGGSAVKLGGLVEHGTVIGRRTLPISRETSFEALIAGIVAACAGIEQAAGRRAAAAGVACPGYCDPDTGETIDGATNIPCLRGRNLRLALMRDLGLPVICENDGVAAALGELTHGAGRSLRCFAMITLGTGVGGAVVLDGRVITGPKGEPPEFGAIVLDASTSGGTFEHFASSAGFLAAYRRAGGEGAASGAEVAALAAAGGLAEAAVEAVAARIAQACGSLANALNLEACLLGGGLAQACSSLPERVTRHLPRFTWPSIAQRLTIAAAETGTDAGLIGAACRAAGGLAGAGG